MKEVLIDGELTEETAPTEDDAAPTEEEAEAPESFEALPDISTPPKEETDYEKLIEEDLALLENSFPELSGIKDITELENPTRYAALRDLGLSPAEAYKATSTRRAQYSDNRAHLQSSAPRTARSSASQMTYRELESAREIFSDISDAEIQRLYKKVTR